MKQEHRFVAQLFGYLAPFVDETKPLFLSLDGVAAKKGVKESHFQDSDVPDIWFTLQDGRHVRIEAKIVSYAKGFTVGQSQHRAWFRGKGLHVPTGWVVADEALTKFFYWPHRVISKQPTKRHQKKYFKVVAPSLDPMFHTIRELALHILTVA